VRLRVSRPQLAPQLGLVIAFALWSMVTVLVKNPGSFNAQLLDIAFPIVTYLVVAHGIQTFRALQLVTGTMLAVCLLLAAIGIHQGQADYGCVRIDPHGIGDCLAGAADGRPCDPGGEIGLSKRATQCYGLGAEPGKDYVCERVGLLGTSTVTGRVRYRGILQD